MIDGLKLTMTGVQLKTNIEGRIRWHQSEIRRLAQQLKDDQAPLPEHMIENEIGRTERQIEVLTFIRDYIVADEVYRLGEFDLRFADLLPEDDPWDCGCDAPRFLPSGMLPARDSDPH